MKKLSSKVIILTIVLGFGFLIGYLLFKTWNIFGFWTLAWTGILSFISTTYLGNLIGSRSENDGIIKYNPKEWPKFINMMLSLLIGYYLYTKLNNPTISSYDYAFGMSYLILLTVVPILFALYKLIRDRNDFIVLDMDGLNYKDNKEVGSYKYNEISKVEILGGIKLTLKNDSSITIKTDQMNFNLKDLSNAISDIKKKLPQLEIDKNVSEIISTISDIEKNDSEASTEESDKI
jgi:hypothetical protein